MTQMYRRWLYLITALVAGAVFMISGLPYRQLGIAQAQGIYTARTASTCGSVTENGDGGFPVIDATDCLPDTEVVAHPTWAPITPGTATCQDWLVYHTNQTGDWEVFRLGNLPDGVQADPNLTRGVGPRVYDIAPTRSPDQKWIAFMSNRDGNWEIYVSAVDKSQQQRVTYNTKAIERNPNWSPDGQHLVYESNRNGNWDLYEFDLTTGVETQLTQSSANDVNPAWSPDGSTLLYQNDSSGVWQIYELTLSTQKAKLLSDGKGDDRDAQYSFDGKQISFRSYRDNNQHSAIFVMNADGSGGQQVSDGKGNALNQVWSKDDSLIAYQSNLDGDYDIYVYDVKDPQTRLVTDNKINDYAPTWICDSTTVVFTSDITTDANIFSTDALPIKAPPILVQNANQMTFDLQTDEYPLNTPLDESASQEGSFPSPHKAK